MEDGKGPTDMKQKAVCGNDDKFDGKGEGKSGEEGELGGLPLEKLSLGPTKKLLVLNLGGFLCDRINSKDRSRRFLDIAVPMPPMAVTLCTRGPAVKSSCNFAWRNLKWPFGLLLKRKLRDTVQTFFIIIIVVPIISAEIYGSWIKEQDQDYCEDSGFSTLHNKRKPIFLKELKKVWDIQWRKGRFSASNTLMIEDEPYKCLLNPPNTAIFLTEYTAENVDDAALGPESELRRYLDGLAEAVDVPSYVEAHPLGKPAITAAHPDWAYYSKIIRRHNKK